MSAKNFSLLLASVVVCCSSISRSSRSLTSYPSFFIRLVRPATRIAEGPRSTPAMVWPKLRGTPRILTFLPVPGRSWLMFPIDQVKRKRVLRFPFEGNFGECRIRIGSVVNRFDREAHPFRPDRTDIDLLALHPIGEAQFSRTAIRELRRDCS